MVSREVLSEHHYLLMLMELWYGDWNIQLERMNTKVDEDNSKATGMVNGGYLKVRQFSNNEFWKNIGGLISASTFGIGGLRL